MNLPSGLAVIVVALVLITAATAVGHAANAPTLAPPGAPFDIDRAQGDLAQSKKRSWLDVWSAWIVFGPATAKDPRGAKYLLRQLMLETTTDVIDDLGRKLDAQDWNPRFKALFADARAWRKKLAAMSMDQVYEVRNSLYRLAEGTDKKEPKRHYGSLAFNLDYLLFNLGHMPTLFELAIKKIQRRTDIDMEDGYAWIKLLAGRGDYAPAQIYWAQIQLDLSEGKTGAAADDGRMAAYFWLRKAARQDPSVGALLSKVRNRLTPAQIDRMESLLADAPGR